MRHRRGVPWSLAAVVTGAILAGCSGAATPAPSASVTAAGTPAAATPAVPPSVAPAPSATAVAPSATPEPTPTTFVSKRHGYSVTVPAGWAAKEYPGDWRNLSDFGPGKEVPGEDLVAVPGSYDAFLIANAMPLPSGVSSAEWQAAFDKIVADGVTADCPITTGKDTVGGEPAAVGAQQCDGSVIVGRSLVHGGSGYYFTIRYPQGDDATKAILDQVVESIQFTGG